MCKYRCEGCVAGNKQVIAQTIRVFLELLQLVFFLRPTKSGSAVPPSILARNHDGRRCRSRHNLSLLFAVNDERCCTAMQFGVVGGRVGSGRLLLLAIPDESTSQGWKRTVLDSGDRTTASD